VHSAEKDRLRRELLTVRGDLSRAEIDDARARVRAIVLDRAREHGWRSVAAYVPLRTEPGSVELLDELTADGVRVIVPLLRADRDLDWQVWDPQAPIDPMEPAESGGEGALGTDAIATVDAVVAPALAVARDSGTRLGRGGGSYDAALARVRPGTEIVALVYDGEIFHDLPADDWDVPVTAAVTPTGWAQLTVRPTE
jgi:5-formyltetrahydrofolate cyclo-ligase